ncbi:MAG: NAD(P)H-hydrate dehydratase [Methylococcales bacterium]|nr:NAD(P)H-hydrate dehydratase [Methylococcales bacterium]
MDKLPEKLYLAEQVREIERIAIEDYAVPSIDLMRQAGLAVFELIKKQYIDDELVVFCGSGNNAGDGYVLARLAIQADFKVTVYYLSKPDALKGDALIAYQEYIAAEGNITQFNNDICLAKGVVVDALFGTGLNREVSGIYAAAIKLINDSSMQVVSIDIPSGLNADTGALMGNAVKANHTISFVGLKQGLFTGVAAEYCGSISYSQLNINNDIFQQIVYSAKLMLAPPVLPKRNRVSHKGHNGHVLLVGGDIGFSGAIKLASEAALRVGAGLVTVVTREKHAHVININRPEIMCRGIEDVETLSPLLDKASVVVIGPGLGQSQWAKELLAEVIASDKPLVCDADALNLMNNKDFFRDNWVLTPHPGEAARLLNCSTQDVAKNRFEAVSKIQQTFGGVCVLKGAGTLIDNGCEIIISTTGNPGMASGGMGDVLTGMIGGFIAQKSALQDAAKLAVYLHGQAADLSAKNQGERGMLASDLMSYIRKLVN